MAPETRLALVLGVASLAAYLFTPVAIQAAGRLEFFDKPKGYKGHAKPIPYLGGAAVLSAFVVVILAFAGDASRTIPLIGGAAILWVVGTVDDRRNLSPGLRVLIEIALAIWLWAADLGWATGLGGGFDLGLTILWILAVVNAFNLFDNMDGASSSMAVVLSGTVAILGLVQDDVWLTVTGAALAGSCLGFLPYNLARPQARIFLGDGGSMPVGFAIATLVMIGAGVAADGWQSVALGLLLVGVPATDTALVIISRRRKGISVLTGGRDHLTHRTRRRLGTAHGVATTLGALQIVIAAVALVALDVGPFAIITATVLVVGVVGAVITLLELEEDRLMAAGEIFVPSEALDKAREKREKRPDPHTVGDVALVALALGAALSPFAFGFYNESWWVPLGLGLVVIAAMGAIRRPQRLPLPAWLVLGSLTGIGLLALVSASWADAPDQAVSSANRWLVTAVIAGLALLLMRSRRRDRIAIITLAAGTVAVAGWVLVRMLGSDGASVFLGGRLHEPLGYINAQATVFIMGIWLFFAGAERREGWLAGLGMTGVTVMTGLALLSQSRGAAIAAIGSVAIVMLAVPGRQRRAVALAVLAAAVAIMFGSLSAIYDALPYDGSPIPIDIVRRAAVVLVITSIVTGIVWGFAVAIFERTPETRRLQAVRVGRIGATVGAAVVLLAVVVSAGRISNGLADQWDAFTDIPVAGQAAQTADAGGSRLVSGAGNRYEYWRVALKAFRDEPLTGTGAGNFDRAWYADRRVAEDIKQPHSFELQLLGELGIGGGILLLVFLGGMTIGIARVHRHAAEPGVARTVAVAAVGVPAAWLVHTTVDWQHLIPGTTAVAFLMLAGLVRQSDRLDATPAEAAAAADAQARAEAEASRFRPAGSQDDPVTDPPSRRRRAFPRPAPGLAAFVVIGAVTVSITGASLIRQSFADHYREQSFAAITTDPAEAIEQADRSLRLDGDATRSYYAKAAALARLNRAPQAEAALREAIEHDATNPVTWALLGDLTTRRGDAARAQRYYRKALSLNPLDPGLQELAAASGASAQAPPIG